jgi:hypothetical protein
LAVAAVLLGLALVVAPRAWAAGGQADIVSDGPLTRIIVSGDLNCQVTHEADTSFEFFGGELGACGTFVAIGDTVHGPAEVPSGGFGITPWVPVSQTPVTGSGSGGDPYRVVTVVDASGTSIRVEQTDTYVEGDESYRTDMRIVNNGGSEERLIVYRAADCYLQDSDVGFGRVDDGAPACVISQAADARIEQWVPITPGSRYTEGQYTTVWQQIADRTPFPNTCACDTAVDNGAGLSWEVSVGAGGSTEISHLTFFSPEGRQQPTTTLRDSVPGPAEISLDPVIVATSVAVTAGVVLVVPFPAALFNSTLEQHYAEVVAARRRFGGWLSRLFARAWARLRRAIGGNRGAEPAAGNGPATGLAADGVDAAAVPERPVSSFWSGPRGVAALVLISAVLYSLLDPTFGFSLDSLGTVLGLAIGLAVMLAVYAVPLSVLSRRLGARLTAAALPGTIAIAAVSVLISRLADFQPGYLYGLIIGFGFTRELSRMEEGRLEAIATGSAFAAGIVAWLLLPVVRAPDFAGGQAFLGAVLETAFVTVVVAGLEATLFGMLPLRFLPGERVRAWNQRVWIALIGLGGFGFFHILLNPSTGYLADTSRTQMATVIWLLVIFGGGSLLFWAYFRFRGGTDAGASATPPPSAPPPAS